VNDTHQKVGFVLSKRGGSRGNGSINVLLFLKNDKFFYSRAKPASPYPFPAIPVSAENALQPHGNSGFFQFAKLAWYDICNPQLCIS